MLGKPKRVSVGTANELLSIIWPEFVEVNGCVFAAFQWTGNFSGQYEPRTETECFINHTHILDELRNKATFEMREPISEEIDELEQIYDETHPDFIGACRFGKSIARAWTLKLKYDFPHDRFRIYYTQYDNPIVRFHKVRANEHVWMTDEALLSATDASFRDAIIYDTDYPDAFVVKGSS